MPRTHIPCGRQVKDVELLNCLQKYKKLCAPLKPFTYREAFETQRDFIVGLNQQFMIDTQRIAGTALNPSVLKQIIKKTCKKNTPTPVQEYQ